MRNTVVEEDETFTVILQTSEAEITFRNEQAVVTIIETDGEKPIPMFAI